MSEWKRVGHCPVDAGWVMLVDPCYVLPDTAGDEPELTYNELLELAQAHDYKENFTQIPSPFSDDGKGIVIDSGYGDGQYSVYIRENNEGRVIEAKIVFIREESELADNDCYECGHDERNCRCCGDCGYYNCECEDDMCEECGMFYWSCECEEETDE